MPNQWPKVRLAEVLKDLTDLRTFQVSDEDDIVDPTISSATHTISVALQSKGFGVRVRKRVKIEPGDLVFSRLHTQNGAFAFANQRFQATGTFIPLALDGAKVEGRFLFWALDQFVPTLSASDTVGRETFKTDDILALQIPLPPLPEQRRVLARIEQLAAQIHEARSLRQQAAEEADAILATARRGVLKRCTSQIVPLEDACASIIDNLHSNPRISESGIPCIRSPDVGYGTLDLAGAQRTDEDEFRRRTVRGEPKAGDIVLVREGGGTGKCAVVLKGQRFSLGQRVMMLRPNADRISPSFLLHQMLSPQIQEDQIAPLSKGSASPHLNIGSLRQFRLILPTLPEQRRIVAELDALQAQVDALTRLQAGTAAELDALLPAILDRAFKGEL